MVIIGLQLWLPLNGDIKNYGLCNAELSYSNLSFEDSGKIGKCLSTGAIVMSAETTGKILNNNAITISLWLYVNAPTGSDNREMIFGNNEMAHNNNRKFSLFQYPTCNDFHYFWMNDTSGIFDTGLLTNVLPSYQWTHIAVTYDNPNTCVYINGKLKHTSSGVSNSASFHYTTNVIHNSPYHKVNDFRLYDECLSPKQIKYISQAMICHYPMGNVDGKIGGRNLLMDSANNYAVTGSDYAAVSNRAIGKIEILTTDAGNAYGFIQDKFAIPPVELGLIAGTEYTYSIDIKLTGSFTNFRASIDYRTLTNTLNFRADAYTDKTGEWIRISATDVTRGIADASNSLYVFNWDTATVGSIIEYKNPKLERGNKATDWTPAPEDNSQFYDNIIPDISGYQNNATVKDSTSPTWSDDSPRYLGSYYFSAKSYLKFPNPIYDNKTIHNLTINMWVKLDSGCGGYATILSGFNSGVSNFPWICVNTEGFGLWSYIGSNTPNYGSVSNEYLSLNTWYMITYVFDSGSVYWYLNGVRKGDITKYTTLNYINADMEYLAIGNSYTGTQWDTNFCGWISDFRMFTTVLSTDDVKALYQNSASLDSQGNLMLSGEVIE